MRLLLALTLLAATPAIAADPVAATAPATRLSLDTPIETLMADPAGKAVVQANFPDMPAHPMYDQFKSMSLNQVAPMSRGKITDAMLAKAASELAAIK